MTSIENIVPLIKWTEYQRAILKKPYIKNINSIQVDIDRFWNLVNVYGPDECWEWHGYRNSCGYGIATFNRVLVRAHRLSLYLNSIPIPDSLLSLHKCDNRPCCNPRHLYVGTVRDNNTDTLLRGRSSALAAGEKSSRSKLSNQQAMEIVDLLRNTTKSSSEIAAMYPISNDTVQHIMKGIRWPFIKVDRALLQPAKEAHNQ